MPGGGRLDVSVVFENWERIVFSVADSGPGMSDEELERVFDPFFSQSLQGSDIGLGMSIARNLVERMGGEISVESSPRYPPSSNTPVCTLIMDDTDFLAMMNGTLPAMQAYTSGKLIIEGDIMKSQLIEKLFDIKA